jgi:ATP-dependent DNA ligase
MAAVACELGGETISLFTQRGYDWTDCFRPLRATIETLLVNKTIFDEERVNARSAGDG